MSPIVFDKDTLLDLTVNIVPLAILGFFFVVFVLLNPWEVELGYESVLQFLIVGSMFVGLAILTYAAAVRIETDEEDEA